MQWPLRPFLPPEPRRDPHRPAGRARRGPLDRARQVRAGSPRAWAARSVRRLVITRSGSGLGQATAVPAHSSLMSDWFPIAARPRVFSLYRFANALGAFVGPLLAGGLAAWIGWRAPFIVLAVPTVILVLLGLRLVEPVRGVQEREAMGMEGDALRTEEPSPSFAESWRMIWKVASLRPLLYAPPFLAASIIGFASLAALLY